MELNVTDWELFLWLHPEYGRKVFNGFANELMAINNILLSMKSFMSSGKLSFLFERKHQNYFKQPKKKKTKNINFQHYQPAFAFCLSRFRLRIFHVISIQTDNHKQQTPLYLFMTMTFNVLHEKLTAQHPSTY